jgi:hypothetical protein
MTDILLTPSGDLHIDEQGEISLTESIRQALKIRLQWFAEEWRFAPEFGITYFDSVFVKNPSQLEINGIITEAALAVEGVIDIQNLSIEIDNVKRAAVITFEVLTSEENYREELLIHG